MIYLDNASTTKIYDIVNKKMFEINEQNYFNPSALYKPAIENSNLIFNAKNELAKNLGTTAEHIIFTSGATESNNLAIFGFLTGKKDAEYIFSNKEHPSVFNVANSLNNQCKIVKIQDINQANIKSILTPNTHLISVIHVSNETGEINDIKQLCKLVHEYNSDIIFHCDGTQAFGKIPVNVEDLGVDAYTISAHKFHGPKGVGALYVKNIDKLKPQLLGGGQQNGKRSGTENISGFVGMAMASTLSCQNLVHNQQNAQQLREYVKNEISANCANFRFNEGKDNSPYILSVSFKGIRSEVLLHMLEEKGILIGTGSACSSKKQSNRVLENAGLPKDYVLGSIRISFSCMNNFDEIKTATSEIINQINILKENIKK